MKINSITCILCMALLFTIKVDAQIGSIITPSSDSYVEGDFGIGHDNPVVPLHVKTTGTSTARFETTNPTGSNILDFRKDGVRKSMFWLNSTDEFRIRSEVGPLIFQTNGNTDRMTIDLDGNVGVNTILPEAKFHIKYNSNVNTPQLKLEEAGNDFARLEFSNNQGADYWHVAGLANGTSPLLNFYYNDNGVGTDIMTINGVDKKVGILGGSDLDLTSGGYLQLGSTSSTNLVMDNNEIATRANGIGAPMYMQYDGGDLLLCGLKNGQVGIGVSSVGAMPHDEYLLAVDGKIASEELLVELSNSWPDYVFEKTYDLKSLEEVEASIKENGHLPGIPSALEVEEIGGIHVGDMQTRTIEKVEELTLYAIDANKKIKELNKENETLKNSLEELIKRIEQLEKK